MISITINKKEFDECFKVFHVQKLYPAQFIDGNLIRVDTFGEVEGEATAVDTNKVYFKENCFPEGYSNFTVYLHIGKLNEVLEEYSKSGSSEYKKALIIIAGYLIRHCDDLENVSGLSTFIEQGFIEARDLTKPLIDFACRNNLSSQLKNTFLKHFHDRSLGPFEFCIDTCFLEFVNTNDLSSIFKSKVAGWVSSSDDLSNINPELRVYILANNLATEERFAPPVSYGCEWDDILYMSGEMSLPLYITEYSMPDVDTVDGTMLLGT